MVIWSLSPIALGQTSDRRLTLDLAALFRMDKRDRLHSHADIRVGGVIPWTRYDLVHVFWDRIALLSSTAPM